MFEKIARFSVRFRWFIIVAWIAAIPVLTHYLPNINDVVQSDNTQFLPKDSPTTRAAMLEAVFQGKKSVSNSIIVAVTDSGPLSPADNAAIERVEMAVSQVRDVTQVQDQGVSADGQARQILVGLTGAAYGNEASRLAANIRDQFSGGLPSGLHIYLTGQLGESFEAWRSKRNGRNNTEI